LQDKNIWLHDSSLWDTVGRDDPLLNTHVEAIRWADVGEQRQHHWQQQHDGTGCKSAEGIVYNLMSLQSTPMQVASCKPQA
jgi:hypothetical protein